MNLRDALWAGFKKGLKDSLKPTLLDLWVLVIFVAWTLWLFVALALA